jgi:hypothetical protein
MRRILRGSDDRLASAWRAVSTRCVASATRLSATYPWQTIV